MVGEVLEQKFHLIVDEYNKVRQLSVIVSGLFEGVRVPLYWSGNSLEPITTSGEGVGFGIDIGLLTDLIEFNREEKIIFFDVLSPELIRYFPSFLDDYGFRSSNIIVSSPFIDILLEVKRRFKDIKTILPLTIISFDYDYYEELIQETKTCGFVMNYDLFRKVPSKILEEIREFYYIIVDGVDYDKLKLLPKLSEADTIITNILTQT